MKARDLRELGVPSGVAIEAALAAVGVARAGGREIAEIRRTISGVVENPAAYLADSHFGALAKAIAEAKVALAGYVHRAGPAPYRRWGEDLEAQSIQQMENACSLPISVRGALMADAHVGYGLPIGGVLATRNAVIPYAVGVDIACRMKMTILDLPADSPAGRPDLLRQAIEDETRFGVGANFKRRREHPVMDEDWSLTHLTGQLKDKAWSQLGTSGSGNHFVEFGEIEVQDARAGIERGRYLALLSHSGSRGSGAAIADHYSKLAMRLHPELPQQLKHLAWLDLSTAAGQEYWAAMELMGRYAAANHACIHRHIAKHLGAKVLCDLENHHNFAWREFHDGEELIVHRKGATPAGEGVLGIIPGSMASATYVVRGRGSAASLNSAAHGAGRVMSRTQARNTYRWKDVKPYLAEHGVTLLSAGIDEVPMVYKNIEKVMTAQADLVEPLARFTPRLVKMASEGERPED